MYLNNQMAMSDDQKTKLLDIYDRPVHFFDSLTPEKQQQLNTAVFSSNYLLVGQIVLEALGYNAPNHLHIAAVKRSQQPQVLVT